MVCKKCNNIISESSLRCPYCGNKIADDYFGYHKANDIMQLQQSQPKPKDKSGKIVLIVLSAVGGLFSIVCMLLFAFSGFGNSGFQSTGQNSVYDAQFSVNNNFNLSVCNTSSPVSVAVSSAGSNDVGRYDLSDGGSVCLDYPDGIYDVLISKSLSDYIRLQVTVSSSCNFSDLTINYDARQIIVLGNDGVSNIFDSISSDNNSGGNSGDNPVINETTTASNGSQNSGIVNNHQSNYDNSSGFDYDRTFLLSGVSVLRSNGTGYTESITYEKDVDGYKMIIKNVNITSGYEYTTAYFNVDKKLIAVERESNYDYYGVNGEIRHEYVYDENGFIKGEYISDADGNGVGYEYQCNADGNIINIYRSGTYGMAQEIVYEYNGPNVVKKYWLYGGDSEIYYEYDGDRIVKESLYSSDSNRIVSEIYYTYDSLNRLTYSKCVNYYNNPSGEIESEYFYTYDGITLSSCTGYEIFSSGKDNYNTTYGYDDRNNIVSKYEKKPDLTVQTDYKYDYISYEYKGLLEEYCRRFGSSTVEKYYYDINTPYVIY